MLKMKANETAFYISHPVSDEYKTTYLMYFPSVSVNTVASLAL